MTSKTSFSLDGLQNAIASVFSQVQTSSANHKKNCVNLYKFHVQIAGRIESDGRTTAKLVGEDAFVQVFCDMMARVLTIKKGAASADRTTRFIGFYLKYINERVMLERTDPSASTAKYANKRSPEEDDEETFVSRFVCRFLKWILRGFQAKDKNVRYRSVSTIAETILWFGQLDIDIYESLRENLVQRLADKEPSIRAQAVVALSRLSIVEDSHDIENGEKDIGDLLNEMLIYDDEAEVRRATLVHTPLNRVTIDVLLSCSRDVDLLTRKSLYIVFHTKLDSPRFLTLVQREKVVKDGLGDREGTVRAAASKLIMKWFDFALAEAPNEEVGTWLGDDRGIMRALIRFLELFDVIGGEQIALDALNAIFIIKPDYLDAFTFTDDYWATLTPESASLARVFVVKCRGSALIDDAGLPIVTAFAFYIQAVYNKLLGTLQVAESVQTQHKTEEETEILDELFKIASILSSMLSMATGLDYSDEVGRRKAFSVVRDMLAQPTLPLDLIDPCMEMMKAMMPSEREFVRVIVEVIIDLRDNEEPTEEPTGIASYNTSFSDSSHSKLRRERPSQVLVNHEEGVRMNNCETADSRDLRCLMICNSVLERVNGPFDDNSTLQGVLSDLIIPSVQRKELLLREKALASLGLCSLIAKRMALGSFELFSNECLRAPDSIRVIVLRVVFDLMLMYEGAFFGRSEEMDSKLITFLLGIMEFELGRDEPCPEILALLCIGFSKLLLLGIVNSDKMLLCLLIAYISPETVGNNEARQCLSYFFIRYCMAHPQNKVRLQSIFMAALDAMIRLNESLDESQDMITPEKFGEMLLAWSDPQFGLEGEELLSINDLHAKIAVRILIALYDSERSDYRILCHLLNQPLFLPEDLDRKTIHMMDLLLNNHGTQCPFDDAAITKAFDRFKTRFNKIYSKRLTDINPPAYVHDDGVLQIYKVINIDVPQSDGAISSSSWKEVSKRNAVFRQALHPHGMESRIEQDGDDGVIDEEEAEETELQTATPGPVDEDLHMFKSKSSSVISTFSTPTSVTPKIKGAKRIRTTDSGRRTERKRNRVTLSRDLVSSESESEDENETSTPVKSKVLSVQATVKQLEIVPKKQRVKLRRAPSTKTSTATSTAATKTVTSNPRGRRKLPTPSSPSDNSEVEEESKVERAIRTSPRLDEHSSDELVAYSDEF